MFDDTLLDDPVRLADADTGGLLRAAAMAGAQVRSTAESAREVGLAEYLDVTRPRAVVLIGKHGVAKTATGMVAALLTPDCPVPVVLSDTVPSWIGALDVVYAHVDDPGDIDLANGLGRAARYGASIVLSGCPEGPAPAAVAGKGIVLRPRVPGVETAFAPTLAAGLLIANALGLLEVSDVTLADELDSEAERDHLGHESFVNPAKSLALRLAERTPLLWGLDPVGAAVGAQAAHVLAADAAVVADSADYRQAVSRGGLHRAAVAASSGGDLFADPDEVSDGRSRLRLMLLAVRDDAPAEVLRRSAEDVFTAADLVDITDEIDGDEIVRAAVLALRFEMAAVYLGLAAGTIGGADRFTPAQA